MIIGFNNDILTIKKKKKENDIRTPKHSICSPLDPNPKDQRCTITAPRGGIDQSDATSLSSKKFGDKECDQLMNNKKK